MHLAPRHAARPRPMSVRRSLAVRLSSEHMLPILAAVFVLGASLISFQPATASAATGSVDGAGSAPRIAIGGTDQLDPRELAVQFGNRGTTGQGNAQGAPTASYADDGTIYKGVAVDTSVADGSALLQTYTVRSGDTLTGIASHYGISMMTIWWANKLTAKDQLHVGQKLVVPPVNGLVITVKTGDTLDSIATQYKVDGTDVLAINQLEDPNLIIGQTLILPDAAGAPIATQKPSIKPRTTSSGSSSCGSCGVGGTYSGGAFAWPVIGGNNYISQYFHYGHYAIDIAATYGSKVVAAAKGTVTFAGWKNNGGGYQVWVSHGSGLFTTYNHMSGVTVSAGQSVGRGQQVGRIGATGDATGPHLHFEVWKGPIWNGGTRVNPLRYF
ncbi:MAG: peptidoglycan DD-metalloendopeptidase family protein [Chloroflexota bacterium]